MNNQKPKFQIIITGYDDHIEVNGPTDFLLFRDMMCQAERAMIEKCKEARQHDQQRRILMPVMNGILPLTSKN